MKRTVIHTLILILFASCLAGCVKDKANLLLSGSISGRTIPARAAKSISAVSVPGNTLSPAYPDSSGHFRIADLKPGTYKIGFAADSGFVAPDTVLLTVMEGQDLDMGTITLKTRTYGSLGSIRGKVSPAGVFASITVTTGPPGYPGYATRTDTAGNFRIDAIVPGTYTVSLSAVPGYTAPKAMLVTVTAGQITDLGTLVFNPVVYPYKAVDTIVGTVFLINDQLVNEFLLRARMDSAIVVTDRIDLSHQPITPELASALNKIIAVKTALIITGIPSLSIAFKSLREVRLISVFGCPDLTSVDISALNTVNSGIEVINCPALTAMNISAMTLFAGSLTLRNSGFKDLLAFSNVQYKPFTLDIQSNMQLKSLRGLNFASDSVFDCTIRANPLLTSLDGLQGIKRLKHEMDISNNATLQTLTGLENIIVAKRLTLSGNPQLNAICPAKQLLNILKNAPPYQENYTDAFGTRKVRTIVPLAAANNGQYITLADLLAGMEKCP